MMVILHMEFTLTTGIQNQRPYINSEKLRFNAWLHLIMMYKFRVFNLGDC